MGIFVTLHFVAVRHDDLGSHLSFDLGMDERIGMEVASVSFSLFAVCVRIRMEASRLTQYPVYKLLLDASDMPKTARYLHVRLRLERDKLVDWALLVDLSEDESTLGRGLKVDRHLVTDALQEIKLVLVDLVKLSHGPPGGLPEASNSLEDEHHVEKLSSSPSTSLGKRALEFANKTQKFPRRLWWISFTEKDFETRLQKLTSLNESLSHVLERHQRAKHLQMQHDTYIGILQTHDKLDDLAALVKSLGNLDHEKRLRQITQFKALNIYVDRGGTGFLSHSTVSAGVLLKRDFLTVNEDNGDDPQPYRSYGLYNESSVWVEWKYYGSIGTNDEPPSYVENRIAKLAVLLRDDRKPEEFRVPSCVGYVKDLYSNRFGFVYGAFNETKNAVPTTLWDALESQRKPSLSMRIDMARAISSSLWYLHATDWLHKSLRSDNIVLKEPVAGPLAKFDPYLVGFEYSRPANPDEVTEGFSLKVAFDLRK
ncbi:hypothetical protein SLS63_013718 [Diaporthe eres]|uniref:Prion-inhibition and propagation HeLo domain-containing protein n=1 Tax=Diaporthe eres TaxID=83184 RepID=A0ABR1NMT1_DIAER